MQLQNHKLRTTEGFTEKIVKRLDEPKSAKIERSLFQAPR